tara:strand:- start:109 stop:327 length:219 start_codon:yes stop_codon:yes gene_type:complete
MISIPPGRQKSDHLHIVRIKKWHLRPLSPKRRIPGKGILGSKQVKGKHPPSRTFTQFMEKRLDINPNLSHLL